MQQVFLAHELVAEYPQDHLVVPTADGGLEVQDASGSVVKRYAAGEWHAAGTGILCGYVDKDDSCDRCRG